MTSINEAIYKPSAWGSEFHALRVDEALGAGSAGPGKTQVLIMDPIYQVVIEHDRCLNRSHPHRQQWGSSSGWALHLRRTMPQCLPTIARCHSIFKAIDPACEFSTKTSTFHFRSGYRYQFGHCAERNDWENYMSAEFSYIAFDELTAFEEEQYDQIITRVRSSDPVLRHMLKIRAMSNPMMRLDGDGPKINVSDPHWVRGRFVEPAIMGREILTREVVRADGRKEHLTRIYLPARLHDNPNKAFVDQYERSLLGRPEHIKKALLEGDWFVTVGSYFAEAWRPALHVCRPFRIPPDWPQFRSMDWGFKRPGCVHWWAMDPDGNLFGHKEMTFRGRTAKQVAGDIQEVERDLGLWDGNHSGISGVADTQLWEQRGDGVGKSKAQEMAEEGVGWERADKKSRQRNAERVTERLEDHDNETVTPGLVLFSGCKQLIKTLPSIQADPHAPECPADGGDDHWIDSLFYAVAKASRGRKAITNRRRDEWADDEGSTSAQSHGRNGYGSVL